MKKILVLLGVVLCIGNVAVLAQPAELTGNQILQKSAETYAKLPSYSGSTAVITQTNFEDGSHSLQVATAQITFERSGALHIEGQITNGNPYSIDSDGKKATLKIRYSSDEKSTKTTEYDSVDMAIAGATGIAANAPTIIPAALLQSNWGNPFFKNSEATLLGKETINNIDYYKVTASLITKGFVSQHTYWIDTQNLMLVQMREENKSGGDTFLANLHIISTSSLFTFANGKFLSDKSTNH